MDTGSNASGGSGSENLKELSEEDVAFSPPPHDRINLSESEARSSSFSLHQIPSTSKGSGASPLLPDGEAGPKSLNPTDIITDQLTTGNGSATIGGINLGDSSKTPMTMSSSPPTPRAMGSNTINNSPLLHPSSSLLENKQTDSFRLPDSKKLNIGQGSSFGANFTSSRPELEIQVVMIAVFHG